MKLPSGREISNERIADEIDAWVLRALEAEESLKDWENVTVDSLSEDDFKAGTAGYGDEDTQFIISEIRSVAQDFYNDLWAEYGRLHEKHVHSRFPHEG